jgi:hypothetical protein
LAALLAAMTASDPTLRPSAAAVADALTAQEVPADATAVLPVASDVTAAIPAPVSTPRARFIVARRFRAPLIAAAIIALLLMVNSAIGGGPVMPATAETSTTSTTATPATVAQTVPTTAAPAPAPKSGKKGDGGGNNGD